MKHVIITTIAAVLLVGCGESKRKPTSILDAVDLRNIEAVKQYITAGTDVNARNKDGFTSLDMAAANGHKEVVKLLIAKGADVNAKNMFGETALGSAVRFKQPETADLLRKHGAK